MSTPTYADQIADFVRERRESLGMSRAQLAEALGVPGSGPVLAKIEQAGRGNITDVGALAVRAVEALGGKLTFSLTPIGPPSVRAPAVKQSAVASKDVDLEHLSATMRFFMAKNSDTEHDVAAAVFVAPKLIRLYASGKKAPGYRTLVRLAEHFGISVAELCFGRDAK